MGIRRIIDVVGASFALLVLAIPFFIIAGAVKLTSPGPLIFRQARYGKGGRVFSIFKLRTMVGAPKRDAEIGDPKDHEARVTSIGIFLRRHRIDELPQLLNVLIGDMSLVGPRPHPVGMHVAGILLEDFVPYYHERHAVRPGITGLAQVMGNCGRVDTVAQALRRVELDLAYIRSRSALLDVCIIVFTAWCFLLRGEKSLALFPSHWFDATRTAADERSELRAPGSLEGFSHSLRPVPASAVLELSGFERPNTVSRHDPS
jgi:lipopolysaccharide/colanic/teichoic acid biosynthesis glycosyltransferase